ncbi:invasin domain 3-containing protein [Citrobacter braakii]|uniref:beta strand repeat-containing protein n=1 Tax=Citrobacter braakii TaxID=57706 RepID=UPI002B3EA307|nr:invasin domain 3-containing protein [Citrobacter braakii]MEB2723305.1 invasin domain 3-containing protein [Citrobacter braakii]
MTGNTDSINTRDAAGTGGGSGENPGEVIDPAARPAAENLNISGKLESGQTLTGSYTFNPNGGDATDKSTFLWTDGGQGGITQTAYTLNKTDIGKILTFTVTPKNGKNIVGTAVSINTKDATGTTGGDSNNPGGVIDPNAKPVVKATDITGVLELGQALEGQYTFNANGADATDKSTFAWSNGGQTNITTRTYSLNNSDVGKTLTFSVTAKNGAGVMGNTSSITTQDAPGTGGGSGEKPGEIIDPAAKPVAKNLDITGKLEVGQTLTGSYTFNPNGGDATDKSTLAWSQGGQSGITTTMYTLNGSDVGKILTFTVTPINGKAVQGTPVSINTKDAAGTGDSGSGENPGEIIDPTAKPIAKDLDITGKLEVGQTLTGQYTFEPNGGDTTDKSTLLWSDGGQSSVDTKAYSLNTSDVGKILTFTVTPKNGKNIVGTPVSINTKDAAGTGGSGSGENPGEIIDPTAKPIAKDLDITGKLEVGQTLTGSYTFNPNGGDATDKSTLAWSQGGQSGITTTMYTLNGSDVGKILTFTVTPKNGKNIVGTPVSINTKDAAGTGGSGSGENPGEIIDPTAKPIAKDLDITGKLEVGQTLTGSYTFEPNGGDTTDKSTLLWSDGGQSGITTTTYTLNGSDVGKILTFTVTPINGKAVQGTPVSINTKDAAGTGGSGSGENPGEIIDPTAKPIAKDLDITGKLEVGQTLTGSYTFEPNGGDTQNTSTVKWDGAGTPGTNLTYAINTGDTGKILTFTVTPKNGKNIVGTPVSINTKDAAGVSGGGGNNPGEIINPSAIPVAENLDITGKLEVNQTLTGSYTFEPNGGDTTDKSTLLWSNGGQSGITTKAYSLNSSDAGKILTFTVTPINGKAVQGTPVSINTKDATGVTGGDGGNKGEIIDPTTTPVVTVTNITGKLEVGSSLTGVYTFDANKGDSRDASTFAWTDGGQSGITTKSYSLNTSDIGKVLTFSVTAKNGAGVIGNTASMSTKDAAGVTDGDTNNPGAVVDPVATPSAKDLDITGKLEVNQTLTGSYTFEPNGGDTTDKSTLLWSNGGQSGITTKAYSLNSSDAGKILTFTVTPINGKAVQGTPVSINTKDATGVTGGDGGNKGEIIDPTTTPVVTVTNITGKLEVGQTLTGHHMFNANGGDSRDASTFLWTDGGQSGNTATTYSLNATDIGKVLTFSVTAVNGAGITGNTDSMSTKDAAGVTGGDSGNKGEVIDPAAPSAKHSLLNANPLSITADGATVSTLTFTAKNAANEAITGLGSKVAFANTGITTTISGVAESADGAYTATLTGTQAGMAIVSVSVDGTAVNILPVQIVLTAGAIDATHSSLIATPDSIVANNGITPAGQSTLTLTLKDTQDNPVTGLTDVALTVADVTGTTLSSVAETPAGSGIYMATLSGTTSGTATVTASNGSTGLSGLQTQVTLTPDITTATVSTVTETTGGAKADNASTNTLTATVEDANGNRVPNATVDWSVTTGIATLNGATSSTDGNGQAIITVKDTAAETATITAKVGSNAADAGQSTDTAFSLYPVVSGITQGVDGSPADNVTANTLVVQVSDLANNPLANQAVTLSLSGTNLGTGPATLKHGATVLTAADSLTATTDGSGQLLLEATDITAESITVSAAVNNGSPGQTQSSVFGLYPVLGALATGITNAVADNATLNSYVATVTDLKGKKLLNTSVTVTFSMDKATATVQDKVSPWVGQSNENGEISLAVRDSVDEMVTMTAHIQGADKDQKTASVVFTPIAITHALVNGYTFRAGEGFPTVGFNGATFQLLLNGTADMNSNYTWSSSQPGWAAINNSGIVTFISEIPNGVNAVTFRASSPGAHMEYKVTLSKWFVPALNNGSYGDLSTGGGVVTVGASMCSNVSARMVKKADLVDKVRTDGVVFSTRGVIGHLFTEYGSVYDYGAGANFLKFNSLVTADVVTLTVPSGFNNIYPAGTPLTCDVNTSGAGVGRGDVLICGNPRPLNYGGAGLSFTPRTACVRDL